MRFGVLADAHYAKGRQYLNRYCDVSDRKLARAVETFIREEVDFVVNLGDIIDGAHGEGAEETDRSSYRTVARILDRFLGAIHHALGNHDVEALMREPSMFRD